MATAQCAHATTGQHYQQLIIMAMLSMVSMYFLMYAMVALGLVFLARIVLYGGL